MEQNGDQPSNLDGLKLEYGFLATHLNSLVLVRYTYFGTYLAAFGWLTTKNLTPLSLISAMIVTVVLWCIELRTRVVIRACTKRLVEIEENEFGYVGYFRSSHPYQTSSHQNPNDTRTTPDIKEPYRFLVWKFVIPSAVGFSTVMDLFFNLAVILISVLLAMWLAWPNALQLLAPYSI
ncbi:hypothetical protein [Agrobacterium tumefaciens]|jgi:hypothetical protein|uniref:hypothetical protein n=1 Tax=Agrobacterium tumefaciens TaxID=358 RepID=UPI000DDB600D|nr:hypothetical protein [Agrobacterium tumefaciens]MDR6587626.1 hypothetical protein [Agrobacterium tumefaciens]